jgi:hypothetical protein
LSKTLNNIVEPESGVTILFNTVDNCEQCGQQNIVQSCFHQHCNNLIVFGRVGCVHAKKRRARCSTGLNNVLLPTLFTPVNNIEQYC